MKVESLHLRNFKRFHEFDIEFKNRLVDEIADRFLILGDNGSGKTTILQAMALALSLVSSKCTSFEDFPWQGWVPGRFMRWGIPRIEVVVHFSAEENLATKELAKPFYERFVDKDKYPYVEPPDHRIVKVILEGARYRTEPRDARFQFYGRGYAAQLVDAGETWVHGHFDKLPGIFWFDQFRSLTVPPADECDGRSTRVSAGNGGRHRRTDEDGRLIQQPFLLRGAELRQYLNSWKLAKLSNAPIKYIDELEVLYSRVFPERSFDDGEMEFRGTTPTPDNTYFLLKDITSGKNL